MRRVIWILALIGCAPTADRANERDAGAVDVGVTRDSGTAVSDSGADVKSGDSSVPADSGTPAMDSGTVATDSAASPDCGARPTPSGDDTNCGPYGEQPSQCPPGCGLGPYWYVCGATLPGVAGCIATGTVGAYYGYCCPTNECVRASKNDALCKDAARPHFYNCGITAPSKFIAAPKAGCDTPSSAGGTCCP